MKSALGGDPVATRHVTELTVEPANLKFCFLYNDKAGDPDRIRTCDPQFRKLMLYPAELRGLA